MRGTFKKRYLFLLAGLCLIVVWISIRPSNDRDWSADQATLAYADIDGDTAHVHNVRNFTYRSTTDFDIAYDDRTYNLNDVETAWFIVEPFSEWKGAAHTFVSFGFTGNRYLAISMEIRKEKGEAFSAFKALFKQYEIMYVIGDERDLIGLQANHRKDDVYVYPVRASKENIRKMFLSMLERANTLRDKPEFYNTLTNTCTTNIARHINDITPGRIPFSFKIVLPARSDELAYNEGLIETDLPFDEARAGYRINDRAMRYADDPDFSSRIRAAE